MRSTISCLLGVAALAFPFAATAAEKLTIYTYDSFTAEWGPGPQVEKAFEAECACDVEFVSVADGVALLNRQLAIRLVLLRRKRLARHIGEAFGERRRHRIEVAHP